MEIEYTIHAIRRIEFRGVTREDVEQTLISPDKKDKGYKNRELAYKKFGERELKVVYATKDEIITVITVMWK
jgi:SOS response regulatory protein OraA/RecX